VDGYCCPKRTRKTQEYNGRRVHLELAGSAHHHVCKVDAISNIILKSKVEAYILLLL